MIKHLVELGFRIFVLAGIVYMVSKGYTDFSTNTIIISLGLLIIIGVPFLIKVKQHIAVLVVVFIVQAVLASSDFTAVSKKKRG